MYLNHCLRLGFKKMCTIEEIRDAYPLLDMVDHDNRKRIAKYGYVEKEFPRVEGEHILTGSLLCRSSQYDCYVGTTEFASGYLHVHSLAAPLGTSESTSD